MKTLQTLEDLAQDPNNANLGTERGATLLETSLQKHGAGRSILADKNGVIIAGNKTAEISAKLALPIRVIETDGTELVVVQRTDLDLETDASARELAYADNRVGQLNLEWDIPLLEADLHCGLDLKELFTDEDIDKLLADLPPVELEEPENTGETLPRVAPDKETTQHALYLKFGRLTIPLTEEEAKELEARLEAYREEVGTFYGFVGRLLHV
jgi:hypothetical protein